MMWSLKMSRRSTNSSDVRVTVCMGLVYPKERRSQVIRLNRYMKSFKQFLMESNEPIRPSKLSSDPAFKALDLSTEFAAFPRQISNSDFLQSFGDQIEKFKNDPMHRGTYNEWKWALETKDLSPSERLEAMMGIAKSHVERAQSKLDSPLQGARDATLPKPRSVMPRLSLDKPENLQKLMSLYGKYGFKDGRPLSLQEFEKMFTIPPKETYLDSPKAPPGFKQTTISQESLPDFAKKMTRQRPTFQKIDLSTPALPPAPGETTYPPPAGASRIKVSGDIKPTPQELRGVQVAKGVAKGAAKIASKVLPALAPAETAVSELAAGTARALGLGAEVASGAAMLPLAWAFFDQPAGESYEQTLSPSEREAYEERKKESNIDYVKSLIGTQYNPQGRTARERTGTQ